MGEWEGLGGSNLCVGMGSLMVRGCPIESLTQDCGSGREFRKRWALFVFYFFKPLYKNRWGKWEGREDSQDSGVVQLAWPSVLTA